MGIRKGRMEGRSKEEPLYFKGREVDLSELNLPPYAVYSEEVGTEPLVTAREGDDVDEVSERASAAAYLRSNPYFKANRDLKTLRGSIKNLEKEVNALKKTIRLTPSQDYVERATLKEQKAELMIVARETIAEYNDMAARFNADMGIAAYPLYGSRRLHGNGGKGSKRR